MKLKIRRTKPDELPELMKIYEYARKLMEVTGNPHQWGKDWPPEELLRNDIKENASYVVVDGTGEIVCTFFMKYGMNPERDYNTITDGNWSGPSLYAVVHRLASSGKIKGVGAFVLNAVFDSYRNVRIDTHRDNRIMINLLTSLGFRQCGTVIIEGTKKRIAFEKITVPFMPT